MQKYYIPHKLKIGDITHLSDNDSEMIISQDKLHEQDLIEIETYDKIFIAQITYIEKGSIEIEILEEKEEKVTKENMGITIIQSLSNDSKFNYFLEKSVEIGIGRIIPIESQYSLKTKKRAVKNKGLWKKIVRDATEQSRNPNPTIVENPIGISELKEIQNSIKICLTTENVNSKYLNDYLKDKDITKNIVIAIGPEKGWSSSDIKIFKKLNFDFIKLKGNILRTETTGLIIASIIKYLKEEI